MNNEINGTGTTIPNWPIKMVLGAHDIKGNCTLISGVMENRLRNTSLPPIAAIVAEGNT